MKRILLPHRGAEILFALRGQNIHDLETFFGVHISGRGPELYVAGEEKSVSALEKVLKEFADLVNQGQEFSNGELRSAFEEISGNAALSLHDFFPKRPVVKTPLREVTPRSLNQALYLAAIEQNDLTFSIGPAGTGKTYLAVATAVSCLQQKSIQRIVLARPAVEAGEKLGFLPGDMQEKINPYLRPLYDALFHMMDVEKVEKLIERGTIEIAPLAFMRGRTLNDAFIILDEAQNTTSEQMKMFLTRMGWNSKTVVTGDITQIDLPKGQVSGLVQARELLSGVKGISFCDFNEKDVVRHRLVRLIIQAYRGKTNPQ
ncbi:MAG: PhoH family protein [Acidobacteria bacterium]|nr:PhoH family protein [Acidobacteriota bacterium]